MFGVLPYVNLCLVLFVTSLRVKQAVVLIQVLYKMDRSGECQQISLKDLNVNRELNLVGFTPQMFLEVSCNASAGRTVLHTGMPPVLCLLCSCGRLTPHLLHFRRCAFWRGVTS